MPTDQIENDTELQRVLWACYQYLQKESSPSHKKDICYKWVLGPYESRFGRRFHHLKLRQLAKLGFLEQEETSRAGHRRYYRLVDPERIADLLKRWQLD